MSPHLHPKEGIKFISNQFSEQSEVAADEHFLGQFSDFIENENFLTVQPQVIET
jgi:hypothetical protein